MHLQIGHLLVHTVGAMPLLSNSVRVSALQQPLNANIAAIVVQ